MVVGGRSNAGAQKIGVRVNGADDGAQESEELQIVVRFLAWIKQIHARVGGQTPIVVLAAAVDSGERLLVNQAFKAVLARGHAQNMHAQHLMVGGNVRVFVCRRNLILTRRNFVVARLHWNAKFKQARLGVGHETNHAIWNGSKVMVIKLMALGRGRANERAASDDQVKTLVEQIAVDQKIFLFATQRGDDLRDAIVGAEEF